MRPRILKKLRHSPKASTKLFYRPTIFRRSGYNIHHIKHSFVSHMTPINSPKNPLRNQNTIFAMISSMLNVITRIFSFPKRDNRRNPIHLLKLIKQSHINLISPILLNLLHQLFSPHKSISDKILITFIQRQISKYHVIAVPSCHNNILWIIFPGHVLKPLKIQLRICRLRRLWCSSHIFVCYLFFKNIYM